MSNWKFSFVFAFLVLGLSVSCSKDDDGGGLCGATWASNINDEIEALSEAAAAYGNTGSAEDCEKYKQALRDYVNELSKYESCYLDAGRIEEFRQSVAESQEDIEEIQC